jgi:hypothetical protein
MIDQSLTRAAQISSDLAAVRALLLGDMAAAAPDDVALAVR